VHLLREFNHWVLALFGAYKFPTLFALIFVEELGVPLPLPGDVVVAYAGSQVHRTLLDALAIIGTVALAVTLGSSLLYLVARHYGPAVLTRFGPFLHLNPARVARMERWFAKRGAAAIVLGRLIPGLRIPTTIMAGVSRVPYRTFLPGTLFAAVIWSALYYYAGAALHRAWTPAMVWAREEPEQVASIAVLLVALIAGGWWLRGRGNGSRPSPAQPVSHADQAAPFGDS